MTGLPQTSAGPRRGWSKVGNTAEESLKPIIQPVRLLVSASLNQPANSVFLSQKTSTSQSKPAPAPTSEQALGVQMVAVKQLGQDESLLV